MSTGRKTPTQTQTSPLTTLKCTILFPEVLLRLRYIVHYHTVTTLWLVCTCMVHHSNNPFTRSMLFYTRFFIICVFLTYCAHRPPPRGTAHGTGVKCQHTCINTSTMISKGVSNINQTPRSYKATRLRRDL